jgi:hypothetical protein
MGLDLREYRKPLEDVVFPNGVTHQPIPFGAVEYELWRTDVMRTTDPETFSAAVMRIVRNCYPTVTDDDLLDLNADMMLSLAAYPGEKIEQVRAILKNVAAGAQATAAVATPENDSPPSTPKTSGATSSPKSRRRSARTGAASMTLPSPT